MKRLHFGMGQQTEIPISLIDPDEFNILRS